MCAYLAPETLALDAWGFPVIRPHDLTGRRLRAARAAAAACPKRALHLGHSEPSTGR
jgi:ferredoxin